MRTLFTKLLILGLAKFLLVSVFILLASISFGQKTENYDDAGISNNQVLANGFAAFDYNGFTYQIISFDGANSSLLDILNWETYGNNSTDAIGVSGALNDKITVFKITKTDGSAFSTSSLWMTSAGDSYTITGYNDGNTTDQSVSVSASFSGIKTLNFTGVDELRFEGTEIIVDLDDFTYTLGAANSAPTATAPSAPSVTEDDTNVALADDIQVADTDGDSQTVSFTITGGTLSTGTTGIIFGGNGNGSASFTAAGTLAAINTALDAATFTPTPNLNGTNAGVISFTTNDGTVSSSAASVSFNITAVNDAPIISIDGSVLSYTENNTAIQIDASATVSDPDGDAEWNGGQLAIEIDLYNEAADEISISDTDGDGIAITISGTNIFANGTDIGDLVPSGGVATGGTQLAIGFDSDATNAIVQEVFQSIRYRSTSDNPGTSNRVITIAALDAVLASKTVQRTIGVTAVNDDPTISGLPTDITVSEDIASNVDLSAATFNDVDAGANSIVLTIAASTGTLTAISGGPITIGGSGTGTLSLTGAAADIDTYLNTASNIKYTGASNVNGNDAATLTLTANDGGYTGTGGGTDVSLGTVNIDITAVNDAPIISIDGSVLSYTENNTAIQIDASATVSDPDGDAEWNGGQLAIEIDLYNEAADEISISDTDGDGIAITISGTNIFANGTDIGDLVPSGGVATGGTQLAIGFDSDATNAIVQEVFQSIRYRNTSDNPGTSNRIITIAALDAVLASKTVQRTIGVTAVNDDPTISGLTTDITVTEDIASNVDLSAATFNDVDAGANSIVLSIAASTGTLTAISGGPITIGGSDTGTLSLTGAAVDIDTYLNTASNIKYTGASNVNGNDAATLTLTANDGGYSGIGEGIDVSLGTVNVDITAVNDTPTASSFTASLIYQNTAYEFSTANFSYSDIDSDPIDHLRITAVPSNGTLWLDSDASETVNGAEIALSNNSTVSKADLDAGYLKYLNTTGTSSSFTFDVNDGTAYSATTYTATLSVIPEPTVTLSLEPLSTMVEDGGTTNVKATLSHSFNKNVTVNLFVSGVATGSGTDYTLAASSIVISAGNTYNSVQLTSVSDVLDEDDETVIIDISTVINGVELGTQQVTATILDDDAKPAITFTYEEQNSIGESGIVNMTIQVFPASGRDISIPFSVNGSSTATIGADYSITASPVVIPAGDDEINIVVTINSDAIDENNETVIVDIGLVANAIPQMYTSQTINIIDDDALPTIAFNSTGSNGLESISSANLQVDLSSVSGRDVFVDYVVTGTATGADYTLANGTLTISAGAASDNITISSIVDDLLDEDNETVIVTLSNPVNSTLGTNTVHTYTINDNDALPTIAFNSTGSNGLESISSANLQVDLSCISGRDVLVDYAVTGTATGGGTDYTLANGTLTISAGAASDNITISSIVDDLLDEDNETVIVTLSNPVNSTLGTNTVHTYIINDNDALPTIAFNSTGSNGLESISSANLQVDLSCISGRDVLVDYAVTGTATGGGTDYTLANGTLTISAGAASDNITISSIVDDLLDENNETVVVTLSNPTNAILGTNTVYSYTINDNDATPTVSFTSASQSSSSESGIMTITAQISEISGRDITIPFTINSSSTSTGGGTDYSVTASPLTILSGSTSADISITVALDDIVEGNETIIVNMGSPINASVSGVSTHTATITDDDTAGFTIVESDGSTSVSESGTTDTFTVVLDSQPVSNVVLNIDVDSTDEVATDKSVLTFTNSNWDTPQTVTVNGVDDLIVDGNIIAYVTISVNDVSSSDEYDSLLDQKISVTNIDDDIHPSAETNDATSVSATSAILNGTVNANNQSVSVGFEYGSTSSYGSYIAFDQNPVTGATNSDVSKTITNLLPNTTYYFRVMASSSSETVYGDSKTFTTDKYSQIITFNNLPSKTTDDPDFNPSATSNMGLEVSYSSSNLQIATVVNNYIHIVGPGTCVITAFQLGNDTVYAASSVIRNLSVTNANSVDEPKLFTMHPNPARNILHLEIDSDETPNSITVRIVDLAGKIIFSKEVDDLNFTLDLDFLKIGMYSIQIITPNGTDERKLIIE